LSVISLVEEEKLNETLKSQEQEQLNKASMKRSFYTLVASAKKALGKRNMGYYVNSSLLFKEVIKRKKEVDEWPKFVINELNTNPTKWIEEKKLNKIRALYYSL